MIRKLLLLAALVGAVRWLLSRRDEHGQAAVVVGYGDGSAVTLAEGSAERERMLAIARGAVQG